MSTASNDDHWLELITQCRSSGLTDRQWCIENGISASTFYISCPGFAQKSLRNSGISGSGYAKTGSRSDPALGN